MNVSLTPEPGQPLLFILHPATFREALEATSELPAETKSRIIGCIEGHQPAKIAGKSFSFQNGEVIFTFIRETPRGPLHPFRSAGAHALAFLKAQLVDSACLAAAHLAPAECGAVVEGMMLGDYTYASKDSPFTLHVAPPDPACDSAVGEAVIIANATNHARRIAEHPANLMTPKLLAAAAEEVATQCGLGITVLDETGIQSAGLGAISAVARGSAHPPRLITLEYTHPGATETIAIVGKAVNFDSGGLSIKGSQGMMLMKFDKTGATAALGAIAAIARLKPKINVVVTLPSTENVIGPDAYKPGDVITTYTGLTVEIGSTDAEGRLILGDALAYTIDRHKPACIVSIASLTGAVRIALGRGVSAVAGTSDSLCHELIEAGHQTDERVWQMPIFDVHEELLKTEYADTMNMKEGGEASLIQGNVYLKNFVGDTPWAALDIASTAWDYRGAPYISNKGASGYGTRLLTRWICERAANAATAQTMA